MQGDIVIVTQGREVIRFSRGIFTSFLSFELKEYLSRMQTVQVQANASIHFHTLDQHAAKKT